MSLKKRKLQLSVNDFVNGMLDISAARIGEDDLAVFYGQRLGGGSFSDVYGGKVILEGEELLCGVKIFTKYPFPISARFMEHAKNEIEISSKLNSTKYCVRFYGWAISQDDPTLMLVMEKMEGNLYSYRKEDWKTLLPIAEQMCECVEYLHEQEILHLDVKCANFLFKNQGGATVVKICDFGCSEIIGKRASISFEKKGTLLYMPPELENDFFIPTVPKKIDIFSFGMMMRVLFCEDLPFSVGDNAAIEYLKKRGKEPITHKFLTLLSEGKIRPLEEFKVSEDGDSFPILLENVFNKCLRHKPSSRPSMTEILVKLRKIIYQVSPQLLIVGKDDVEDSEEEQEESDFGNDVSCQIMYKKWLRLEKLIESKYVPSNVDIVDKNDKIVLETWKFLLHNSNVPVLDQKNGKWKVTVNFKSESVVPKRIFLAILTQNVHKSMFRTLNHDQIIDFYFVLLELKLIITARKSVLFLLSICSFDMCLLLLQRLIVRNLEKEPNWEEIISSSRAVDVNSFQSSLTGHILDHISCFVTKKRHSKETTPVWASLNSKKLIECLQKLKNPIELRYLDHRDYNSDFIETRDCLDFSNFLDTSSNITIVCQRVSYSCHLEILLLSSRFFEKMFSFGGKEVETFEKEGKVTLEDIVSDTFVVLMKFMYKTYFVWDTQPIALATENVRIVLDLLFHAQLFHDCVLRLSCLYTLNALGRKYFTTCVPTNPDIWKKSGAFFDTLREIIEIEVENTEFLHRICKTKKIYDECHSKIQVSIVSPNVGYTMDQIFNILNPDDDAIYNQDSLRA